MAAEIRVFTFKDGLLARLAHDLQLTLERFEIKRDGDDVRVVCDPASLRVDGAMRRGELQPGVLSDADKRKIQGNLRDEILHTARHPEIVFKGTGKHERDAVRVTGSLELVGRVQPLALTLRARGDRLVGEVELTPSRWGIKPFKALAGAIKLQDRVVVRVDVPAA